MLFLIKIPLLFIFDIPASPKRSPLNPSHVPTTLFLIIIINVTAIFIIITSIIAYYHILNYMHI